MPLLLLVVVLQNDLKAVNMEVREGTRGWSHADEALLVRDKPSAATIDQDNRVSFKEKLISANVPVGLAAEFR